MIRVISDIQENLFQKNYISLVMLDSSCAFDTVDHKNLLEKLKHLFCIGNFSLKLIKSYLEHRSFSVVINGKSSTPKSLNQGVPQGSLLGPLMYILYTKEVEYIAEKYGLNIISYADDMQLYISFKTDHIQKAKDKMLNCLTELKQWMDANFLKLNPNKTQLKLFNPSNSPLPFNLNFEGNTLESINEINLLGVKISNNLNLNSFILKKVQTCTFQLRNLMHIRDSLTVESRITLITTTIIANLDYCNSVLACANGKMIRPMSLILNRAVRFIYNLRLRTHITPYLKKLHILPIEYRIKFKVCLISFKVFNNIAPKHLLNEFSRFKHSTSINLRIGTGRDTFMFDVDIPTHKKETIIYRMKIEWNALPLPIRKLDSLQCFKAKLKEHYFVKAFLTA
jgi:hypothetical protein